MCLVKNYISNIEIKKPRTLNLLRNATTILCKKCIYTVIYGYAQKGVYPLYYYV